MWNCNGLCGWNHGSHIATSKDDIVDMPGNPSPWGYHSSHALTSVEPPYLMELVFCQIIKAFMFKMFGTCSSLILANGILRDTSRRSDAHKRHRNLSMMAHSGLRPQPSPERSWLSALHLQSQALLGSWSWLWSPHSVGGNSEFLATNQQKF